MHSVVYSIHLYSYRLLKTYPYQTNGPLCLRVYIWLRLISINISCISISYWVMKLFLNQDARSGVWVRNFADLKLVSVYLLMSSQALIVYFSHSKEHVNKLYAFLIAKVFINCNNIFNPSIPKFPDLCYVWMKVICAYWNNEYYLLLKG